MVLVLKVLAFLSFSLTQSNRNSCFPFSECFLRMLQTKEKCNRFFMYFRCMRQKAQSRRPPKYSCQSVWSFETSKDDIRTSFTISSATNWARDVSSPCKGLSANQDPKLYWKSTHKDLSQIVPGLLYFTLADNFGRTIIHQTPQALQGFLQTTPSRHQLQLRFREKITEIHWALWESYGFFYPFMSFFQSCRLQGLHIFIFDFLISFWR